MRRTVIGLILATSLTGHHLAFGQSASPPSFNLEATATGHTDYDIIKPSVAFSPWGDEIDGLSHLEVWSRDTGTLLYELGTGEINDLFGYGVTALSDLDGDGADELVVSAPLSDYYAENGGVVFIFSGATGSLIGELAGEENELFGKQVQFVDDFTGDGQHELAVTSTDASTLTAPFDPDAIKTRVEIWDVTSSVLLATYSSEMSGDGFGQTVVSVDDVTGDGVPDLVIASPKEVIGTTGDGNGYGKLSVFPGPSSGTIGATYGAQDRWGVIFGGPVGPDIPGTPGFGDDDCPFLWMARSCTSSPCGTTIEAVSVSTDPVTGETLYVVQNIDVANTALRYETVLPSQGFVPANDTNLDGQVGIEDTLQVLGAVGTSPSPDNPFSPDLNNDGIVDTGDVVEVLASFGTQSIVNSTSLQTPARIFNQDGIFGRCFDDNIWNYPGNWMGATPPGGLHGYVDPGGLSIDDEICRPCFGGNFDCNSLFYSGDPCDCPTDSVGSIGCDDNNDSDDDGIDDAEECDVQIILSNDLVTVIEPNTSYFALPGQTVWLQPDPGETSIYFDEVRWKLPLTSKSYKDLEEDDLENTVLEIELTDRLDRFAVEVELLDNGVVVCRDRIFIKTDRPIRPKISVEAYIACPYIAQIIPILPDRIFDGNDRGNAASPDPSKSKISIEHNRFSPLNIKAANIDADGAFEEELPNRITIDRTERFDGAGFNHNSSWCDTQWAGVTPNPIEVDAATSSASCSGGSGSVCVLARRTKFNVLEGRLKISASNPLASLVIDAPAISGTYTATMTWTIDPVSGDQEIAADWVVSHDPFPTHVVYMTSSPSSSSWTAVHTYEAAILWIRHGLTTSMAAFGLSIPGGLIDATPPTFTVTE